MPLLTAIVIVMVTVAVCAPRCVFTRVAAFSGAVVPGRVLVVVAGAIDAALGIDAVVLPTAVAGRGVGVLAMVLVRVWKVRLIG